MSEPLALVSTWICHAGKEGDLAQIAATLMTKASLFEGHLSGTVLHEKDTSEYHVVHSFSDRIKLNRWLESPERASLITAMDQIATRQGSPQQITGLETWFASRGTHIETIKPPPRWKMWVASFLGAYPLVVLFQWGLAPFLDPLPLMLRSAIFPLILLSAMTYGVMPLITRLLGFWLYPAGDASASKDK